MANFFSISSGNFTGGVFGRAIDSENITYNTAGTTILTTRSPVIPFVANQHAIHSIAVNLSARALNTTSTLILEISSATSLVATETYDINLFTAYDGSNNLITIHPQNWQLLKLTEPLDVASGETYYANLRTSSPDQLTLIGSAGAYDAATSLALSSTCTFSNITPFIDSEESSFNLSVSANKIVDISEKEYEFNQGDFTVEGFFYFNTISSTEWMPLLNFGTGWGTGFSASWGLSIFQDYFYFWRYTKRGEAFVKFPCKLLPTKWYHVAVSRKDNNFYLWVDGECVAASVEKYIYFNRVKGAKLQIGYFNKLGRNFHTSMYVASVRITKDQCLYVPDIQSPTEPLSDRLNTSILYRTPNDTTYRVVDSTGVSTISTFNVTANAINDINKNLFLPRGTAQSTIETSGPFPDIEEYGLGFDGTTYFAASETYGTFATGSFTVEAWIKPEIVTGTKQLWVYSTDATRTLDTFALGVDIVNGSIFSWVVNGTTFAKIGSAQGTVQAGEWVHIAVVRDDTKLTTFIGGSAQSSITIPARINCPVNCILKMGGEPQNKQFYTGKLTNLRFINGAALYSTSFDVTPITNGANITAPIPLERVEIEVEHTGDLVAPVKVGDVSKPTTQYTAFNGAGMSTDSPFAASAEKSLSFSGTASQYIQSVTPGYEAATTDIGFADFTIESWVNLNTIPAGPISSPAPPADSQFNPTGVRSIYFGDPYNSASPKYTKYFDIKNDSFNFGLQNFTIEAWINFTWAPTGGVYNGQIFGTVNFTNPDQVAGYTLYNSNGNAYYFIIFYYDSAGVFRRVGMEVVSPNFVSSFAPVRNTWEHVAVVRNGNLITMFINGIARGSLPVPADCQCNGSVGSLGRTMAESGGRNGYFHGYIEDLRVIPGIAKHTLNFTPPAAPLWPSVANKYYGLLSVASADSTQDDLDGYRVFIDSTFVYLIGNNRYLGPLYKFNHSFVAGEWHHIAFARKNGELSFFMDGTKVGSTLFKEHIGYGAKLTVGKMSTWTRNPTFISSNFDGKITNLRITRGTALYDADFDTSPVLGGANITSPEPLTTYLSTTESAGFVDDQRLIRGSVDSPYTPSDLGQSIYMDGGGGWITLTDPYSYHFNITRSFTVALWVRLDDVTSSQSILYIPCDDGKWTRPSIFGDDRWHYDPSNIPVEIFCKNSSIGVSLSPLKPFTITGGTLVNNTWHYVSFVRDASRNVYELYLDGSLVASAATPAVPKVSTKNINKILNLGGHPTKKSFMKGYIAGLDVVNGVSRIPTGKPALPPTSVPVDLMIGGTLEGLNAINVTDIISNKTLTTTNADISENHSPFNNGTNSCKLIAGNITIPPTFVKLDAADFCIETFVYLYSAPGISQQRVVLRAANTATDRSNPFLVIFAGLAGAQPSANLLIANRTKYHLWLQLANISTGVQPAIFSTSDVTYDVWNHIAVTRQGNVFSLYINGVKEASTTLSLGGTLNTIGSWYIGSYNTASTFMNGEFCNFRVTKGTSVYTGDFNVTTPAGGVGINPPTIGPVTAQTIVSTNTDFAVSVAGQINKFSDSPADGYFFNSSNPLVLSQTIAHSSSTVSVEFWVRPTDLIFKQQSWIEAGGGGGRETGTSGFSTGPMGWWQIGVNLDSTAANFQKIYFINGGFQDPNRNNRDRYISASPCINYDEWNHIAILKSEWNVAIYVNGVRQISTTLTPRWMIPGFPLGGFRLIDTSNIGYYNQELTIGKATVGYISNIHIQDFQSKPIDLSVAPADKKPEITPYTVMLWNTTGRTFLRYPGNSYTYSAGKFPSPFSDDSSILLNSNGPSQFSIMPVDGILNQTHPFTVECWFNLTGWPPTAGTADSYCLFTKYIANQFGLGFDTALSRICLTVGAEKDGGTGITDIIFNKWYHVAVTYDITNTFRVYLDGVLQILFKNTKTGITYNMSNKWYALDPPTDNKGFIVGQNLNGYISNFRISNDIIYPSNTNTIDVPTESLKVTDKTVALYKHPYEKYTYTEQRSSLLLKVFADIESSNSPFGTGVDASLDRFRSALIEPNFSPDINIAGKDFVLEWWENIISFRDSFFPIVFFGGTTTTAPLYVYYELNGKRLIVNGAAIDLVAAPTQFVWRYRALARTAGKLSLYTGTLGGAVTLERSIAYTNGIPPFVNQGIVGAYYTNATPSVFRERDGYLSNIRLSSDISVLPTTVPGAPFTTNNYTLFLYQAPYSGLTFKSKAAVSTQALLKVDSPIEFKASPYNKDIYDCMFFDKTNYLRISDRTPQYELGANRTPFTLELWVFMIEAPSGMSILSRGGGNWAWGQQRGIAYLLGIDGDAFVFAGAANESGYLAVYAGGVSARLRKWTHIAVCYDGTTTKMYINGIQATAGNVRTTNTYRYNINNKGSFRLGSYPNGIGSRFLGYISNFRIVNGDCLYNAPFAPPIGPLQETANTVLLLKAPYEKLAFLSYPSPFTTEEWDLDRIDFNDGVKYLKSTNPIPSMPGTFTIEFWMNYSRSNNTTEYFIDGRSGDISAPFAIGINENGHKNTLRVYAGGANFIDCGHIQPKIWYHVAVVRNTYNNVNVYIDGQICGTFVSTLPWGGSALMLGKKLGGAPANYLGYLSNLRIVSGEEIYTANFTKPTEPLELDDNTSFLLKPILNLNKSIVTVDNSPITNVIEPQLYHDCSTYTALPVTSPYGEEYKDFIAFYYNHHIDFLPNVAFDIFQKPFVIEMWVYPTRPAAVDEFIAGTGPQALFMGYGYVFGLDGNNNLTFWPSNAGEFSSGVEINVFVWTHIAIACTSTTSGYEIDLFVDGDKVFTWNKGIPYISAVNKVALGAHVQSGSWAWPYFGYMADVRLVVGEPSRNIFESNSRFGLTTVGAQVVSDSPVDTSPGSIYLDGTSEAVVSAPATEALRFAGEFTVELWFKADLTSQVSGRPTLARCWSDTYGRGWAILMYTDGSIAFLTSQINMRTGADVFAPNEWTHVSVSRNDSDILIHVNGELVMTSIFSTTIDRLYNTTNYIPTAKLQIGEAGFPLVGNISNVRISSTCLYTTGDFTPEYPLLNTAETIFCQQVGAATTNSVINAYMSDTITVPTEPHERVDGTRLLVQGPYNVYRDFAYTFYNADVDGTVNEITNSPAYYFSGIPSYNDSYPFYRGNIYPGLKVYADDRLSLANSAFIFQAWIYPLNSTSGTQTIIHRPSEYWVYIDTANYLWFRDGNNVALRSNTKIPRNAWTYITITGTGAPTSKVTMFIGDIKQTSVITTVVPQVALNTSCYIGTMYENTGAYSGYISDITLIKGENLSDVVVPTAPPTQTANTVLFISDALYHTENKYRAYTDSSVNSLSTISPFTGTDNILSFLYNQEITIPAKPDHDLAGTEWAIECWLYIQINNPVWERYIVSKGDGTTLSYAIYLSTDNKINVKAKVSTVNAKGQTIYTERLITSPSIVPDHKWTHILVTSDSNNMQVFINGEWDITAPFAPNVNNAQPFTIGKNSSTTYQGYVGYISNFKLTKGDQVYETSFNVPTEAFADNIDDDPLYDNVSLLMHMEGANDSTIFTDSSKNSYIISPIHDTKLKTSNPKFGSSSIFLYGGEVRRYHFPWWWGGYTFISHGSGLVGNFKDAGVFGTDDFTIEFFIKPATGRHDWYPVLDVGAGPNGFEIVYNSTNLFVYTNGRQNIKSAGGWTLNVWHHVVITKTGTTLKMYIDGQQQGKSPFFTECTAGLKRIGAHDNIEHGMYGYIDELRITKGICRYNTSISVPTSPLDATAKTSVLLQAPYIDSTYYMIGSNAVHISSLILNSTRTDITINLTESVSVPNLFIHNRGILNVSAASNITLDIVGAEGLQITSDGRLNIN